MKYTTKEAREILGVTEASSKYEIEKRYDIIMKKYQMLKTDGKLDEKAKADFEKNTDAYRILMGYEIDEPQEKREPTKTDKIFMKAGIDKKKVDNFFHYYKFHIIIGLVAIVLVALTVKSIVFRVEPDIRLGFIGEINTSEFDILGTKIKEQIPEIKEISFDSANYTNRYADPNEYANVSKIMVLLSASDTNVYLINKFAYDSYANNGVFMPLENIAKDFHIDISKSNYLKTRVVEEWEDPKLDQKERKVIKYRDAEPVLYGIDVSDSKFFEGMNIVGPEKILVIRTGTEDLDLILKLVKLFVT
ncbi:hypothetical protein EHE19_003715 [Ruminiclostridium herbifermentans]|uniref:J domain-containing protein n=1 Tax=Ruminiclostridium herbifermentans TaxID=2488810 RepID=A0A4U7JHQ4_9FIRM|nr:hypothetical protein [Ruminiclostridium herbifermentans]QNU67597.1 hypothetical protein EHE19_003715 [Ruminiclostridium herbifermentans]